jgi:flagellar biosynthesis/type III secretory pathway M-ring protein FliF/YscJ
MRNMARAATAMLAWNQVQPADGHRTGEVEEGSYIVFYVLGMFVIVSFLAGFYVARWYYKRLARVVAEDEEQQKSDMQVEIFEQHLELEHRAEVIASGNRMIQRRDELIQDLENNLRHHECLVAEARALRSERPTSHKAVQGPVHYTRRNANPRFQPSADRSWGAWTE